MIELSKLNNFIDNGYSILFADELKRPVCAWKKLQEQAYTKDQLEKAYNNPKNSLAGLITGYNNLEVIDIDLKVFSSLQEQNEFWNEYLGFLKDNIDDFDKKLSIYKTKNKGYHILYKCKSIAGNSKLAKLKGHTECVIETRGIGGYVVIYDNNVSNISYHEIQEISEEDRDILWSCSKTYNYIEETDPSPVKETKLLPKSTEKEITPWEDYNEKTSIFDVIGNEFSIPSKGIKSRFTLIKRDGGTSPHSGYVYHDSGCMYLFSTGTIYPHEKLISPFTAYAYKYHSGDFKSAASDLYHKGYGSRNKKEILEKSKEIASTFQEPKEIYNKEDIVFPIDIFPKSLQSYIIECNKTLDSSIDYMGCSLLWLSSVIIGNSIQVEVKSGWRETCNIWIAVVGKAGLGKTPSIKNIIFPILRANSKEIKDYIKKSEKFEAYEKLSKEEKREHEKVNKPIKTQFIANDITLEALVDLHQESKNSVGVFKDELAGWLKDMNKYREGSDLEFWLSTWSGASVNLTRMTRKGSFVEMPLIPVLGGIQPSVFNTFYTEENKDNGFMDRMLLSFPDLEIEKYNSKELDPELITWYNSSIISFYESIKNNVTLYSEEMDIVPHIAKFSLEAKTEWERIFNDITSIQNSEDENEYMKSMFPKQKSYIPRFSLIIDVINKFFDPESEDQTMNISKESLIKAEKLSKYFVATAKKIKINAAEVSSIKSAIKETKSNDKFKQFEAIYLADKTINKKDVADILGVSRKTIYEFIKKIKV